ncbi:hypothetical protein FRC18_008351 [Serendipita sp. 400]|nr:hypothetical protein FRC18_008351 [Serendipita sp. 400]
MTGTTSAFLERSPPPPPPFALALLLPPPPLALALLLPPRPRPQLLVRALNPHRHARRLPLVHLAPQSLQPLPLPPRPLQALPPVA